MSKYARKLDTYSFTITQQRGPLEHDSHMLGVQSESKSPWASHCHVSRTHETKAVRRLMLCRGSYKWTLFITTKTTKNNKVISKAPRNLGLPFGTAIAAFPKHLKSSTPSQSRGWLKQSAPDFQGDLKIGWICMNLDGLPFKSHSQRCPALYCWCRY